MPGAFKWQWTNAFYLIGETQPLTVPGLDPTRINSLSCVHFVSRACAIIRTLNSGSYPPEATADLLAYARGVSPVTYLKQVKAPTLLVQGQADTLFNLNEATATYRTLTAQGTTTKMIWQSWGHSGGMTDPAAGELDLTKGDLSPATSAGASCPGSTAICSSGPARTRDRPSPTTATGSRTPPTPTPPRTNSPRSTRGSTSPATASSSTTARK